MSRVGSDAARISFHPALGLQELDVIREVALHELLHTLTLNGIEFCIYLIEPLLCLLYGIGPLVKLFLFLNYLLMSTSPTLIRREASYDIPLVIVPNVAVIILCDSWSLPFGIKYLLTHTLASLPLIFSLIHTLAYTVPNLLILFLCT